MWAMLQVIGEIVGYVVSGLILAFVVYLAIRDQRGK